MKDISDQLDDILNDYSTEVRKTVNECCMEVAKQSGLKLRETSPKKSSGGITREFLMKNGF